MLKVLDEIEQINLFHLAQSSFYYYRILDIIETEVDALDWLTQFFFQPLSRVYYISELPCSYNSKNDCVRESEQHETGKTKTLESPSLEGPGSSK